MTFEKVKPRKVTAIAAEQIVELIPNLQVDLLGTVQCKGYPREVDLEALDDLAAAIAQAEAMLAERLGFDVAPVYRQDTGKLPRTHRRDWWNLHVKLPRAYVQRLGSASWQSVQATPRRCIRLCTKEP